MVKERYKYSIGSGYLLTPRHLMEEDVPLMIATARSPRNTRDDEDVIKMGEFGC
jgi:hypothetical protein